jgi:hypothetical protein
MLTHSPEHMPDSLILKNNNLTDILAKEHTGLITIYGLHN